MDLQRSLLIGAIAVLSFMLLTEWVAFKEDRTAAATQETSRLINGDDSVAAELPTLQDTSPGDAADDLPDAPEPDATAMKSQTPQAQPHNNMSTEASQRFPHLAGLVLRPACSLPPFSCCLHCFPQHLPRLFY